MVMKKILIALALLLTGIASGSACTGISFLAEDGGYVQARTIEWGNSYLPSEYVIVPRGQDLVSYTPTGVNGLRFRAKYGLVGLAIIQKEFVAEGLNEVGLSAGLFYFPHYGKYEEYDEAQNAITLSDLQVVNWMLSQFATIDEVREAIEGVKVVSLDKPGKSSTVHWRIGDAKGNQMVLEFVGGVPYFYENKEYPLFRAIFRLWQTKLSERIYESYVSTKPLRCSHGSENQRLSGNTGRRGTSVQCFENEVGNSTDTCSGDSSQ